MAEARIDCSLVNAGEGEGFWIVGDFVRIKVPGEKAGDAFCLVEIMAPAGSGPPPHRHEREDETFYVLEGQFEFLSNDRTVRAGRGSVVGAPRGSVHTYKNVGEGDGRLLVIISPGGFERFFREIGRPGDDPDSRPDVTQADIDKLLAAAPKYGLEILAPQR